jgi:HEAT repeat protein
MLVQRWATIFLLCCAIVCAAQSGNTETSSNETALAQSLAIKEKIRSIMRSTLKQGEFTTPEGIKAYTRVPPSNESTEEVRRLGDGAIPVLAGYVDSPSPREQELAMRFLVSFDSDRIVDALGSFAKHSAYPTNRAAAILFLRDAPPSRTLPIVQEVFKTDSDPYVRKTAAEFLAKHSDKNPKVD